MFFRAIYLSIFSCLFSLNALGAESSAELINNTASKDILNAHYALYQGDTGPAEHLITAQVKLVEPNNDSLAVQQLQVMIWVEQEEEDKATELLLALQKQYSKNADVHSFSAGIWKVLGHQVSIFSKVEYYSRSVAASIRAGELAPNNAKYVRKQASVYAQPEMFGGIEGKQRPMLPKIQTLDLQYGLAAEIDLAQNEQNDKKASQLAEQVIREYPNSFLLVERAAQMHATLQNKARAQQLYAQACNFPAQTSTDRLTWISSCYRVVYLTLKTDKNHSLAVSAMQRLLSVNTLKTAKNAQAKLYLAEMANKVGNKALALATYRELALQGLDNEIKKKARKALKKLP